MEFENEVIRWSIQARKYRKIAENAPTNEDGRKWLLLAYGCDDMANAARKEADASSKNGARW